MQVFFDVLMGLRRSEINGLKYSDVDYINRTLKVERQLGRVHNADMEIITMDTYGDNKNIIADGVPDIA